MSNLRTNFMRCQITSSCFCYEMEIQTNQVLQQIFYEQLEAYFIAINQNIVFDFPYIYSVNLLQVKNFYFMLSNGDKIKIIIRFNNEKYQSVKISRQIHRQMMKMTKFLYCNHLETCFNPFQEKQIDNNISTMPGFYVKTQNEQKLSGYYIVPVELIIDSKETFSQSNSLFNYSTGRFYTKQNIVRYNKQKDQILFRNGDVVKKTQLKSIRIKSLIGYEMASIMYSYNQRIKLVCKQFAQLWQIKYDTRFMEVFYRFIPTGHLIFRGEKDKSLAQLLSPVSLNNYNYNFKNFYNDVCFQDDLNCELYFLILEQIEEYMMTIISWFQNIKQKMGLNYKILVNCFKSYKPIQQINAFIQAEPQHKQRIYVVPKWKTNDQKTEQNQKLIQNFIDKGLYFHQLSIKFQENQDILVLKNLGVIYTKLRLNPWKIKQIPFGNAPFVAFSVNVKLIRGTYAVSVIGTMNAYLTKFTCLFQNCSTQLQISKLLAKLCKQCLQKFKSVHKCTPNRVIVLRSGQAMNQTYLQYQQLKDALMISFNTKITVVLIQNDHPLRLFNQIDMNYISRDTIKKAQLMCTVIWKQEKYIELQLENATYRIKILQIQTLDPNFQNKIIQFLTKMCFGSVGNQFGKGLGFISFAEKLNAFSSTYNIQKMLTHLKEGLLLFL